MRRAAIIPCAGISSRFSKTLGKEVLKVIYSETGNAEHSILAHQLNLFGNQFDQIVIVSGYRSVELKHFVTQNFSSWKNIVIVENPHFEAYGTAYSFSVGIGAIDNSPDEVILMEGDLILDQSSFKKIIDSSSNVISSNPHLIRADSSVAFYITPSNKIKYAFDQNHIALSIPEPFLFIGNSGQVWKFRDRALLTELCDRMNFKCKMTNLEIIEQYFNTPQVQPYEIISFKTWINCNTYSDYLHYFRGLK